MFLGVHFQVWFFADVFKTVFKADKIAYKQYSFSLDWITF
jgi:hypothetical protein